MIGPLLEPTLVGIEKTLWEFEAHVGTPAGYSDNAVRAAVKIFTSAMMDKIWSLQEAEGMDVNDRCAMAEAAGNEIREFVRKFTGIDTLKMYD